MSREPPSVLQTSRISDKAVTAKTGRSWTEWFEQLDRMSALDWDHKTIAKRLCRDYGIDAWWAQTVAVGYEQARGLRDVHQQPDGYEIQRQRTLSQSAERVWPLLRDEPQRLAWLPESRGAGLRQVREDRRYLRLDWPDGRTRVLLGVNEKSADKCVVGVQHSKLPSAEAADEAKILWAERLARLIKLAHS